MYNETSQPPEPYFGGGRICRGRIWSPNIWGPSLLGAEFVRGRVCQGPSLLGAEMSRNRSLEWVYKASPMNLALYRKMAPGGGGASLSH